MTQKIREFSKKDKLILKTANKIADIFKDSDTPITETIIEVGNALDSLDNWISIKKFKLDIDKEWRDVLQADYSLDYENGIQEGFRLAKIIFKDLVPQPPKDTE